MIAAGADNQPEAFHRRVLAWPRIAFWAVFAISVTALFYGLMCSGALQQKLWSREGYKRALEYTAAFGLLVFFVAAFARRWLLPFAILIALLLTFIAVGVTPVLCLALFAFSCIVVGRALFGPVLPWPLAFLSGVALWACAMAATARLPIHYAAVNLGVQSAIILGRWKESRQTARQMIVALRTGATFVPAAFWTLSVTVLLAGVHWLMALEPEASFDGLTAHLTVPAQMAIHHALLLDFHRIAWALMPMYADLCYAVVYAPGGEFAARLLNFLMLLTIVTLIFNEARRVVGPAVTLLLCALFLSLPIAQLVTGSLFVENFGAAMLLACVVAICRYREQPSTRKLLMTSLLLGASGGFKIAALAIALLLFIMFWFVMSGVGRQVRPPLGLRFAALLLFLIPALWPYVHSFLISGDPLFPFSGGLLKSPYIDSPIRDERFSHPLTWRMPMQLTFRTHRFMESRDGAFGFQFLLLVPLSLACSALISEQRVRLPLFVGSCGAVMIAATVPNARYFYPVMPMFTLGMTGAFAVIRDIDRRLFATVCAASVAVLALNLYFFNAANWYHGDFFTPPLFSRAGRERYLEQNAPVRKAIRYLNATDRSSSVLLVREPFQSDLIPTAYADDWHFYAFAKDLAQLHSGNEVYQLLTSLGIKHVVTTLPIYFPDTQAGLAKVVHDCGQPEYMDRSHVVLRLSGDCAQRLAATDELAAPPRF